MQKLTAGEKWSYAIGNIPFSVKDATYANFVVFYYTQVHGLSGTLAGLAMFIALTWDAVTDPVVGSWSDSLRSRWGRRHPLMFAGGLPTALLVLASGRTRSTSREPASPVRSYAPVDLAGFVSSDPSASRSARGCRLGS